MRDRFYLAWRHAIHCRGQSALLVAAIAASVFLPLAANSTVREFERALMSRAEATPLVIGARGSRFDLAFHALYFRGARVEAFPYARAAEARSDGLAQVYPMHQAFTARDHPVVGVTPEYYAYRRLEAETGRLPAVIGECVLGAAASRRMGLKEGDALVTDPENLFDFAGAYPLKLHVTGVLAPSGGPDDGAVFADVKTSWILAGLGHGHQDIESEGAAEEEAVSSRSGAHTVANAALREHIEITPENIESFHFHGDRADMPLTAALAAPRDGKAGVILKGRFVRQDGPQILAPVDVVDEVFRLVFRVKRLFDAQAILILISAALFLCVAVLLSLRLRERERSTLFQLGCSRGTIAGLFGCELGMIVAAGVGIGAALASVAGSLAPWILSGWL